MSELRWYVGQAIHRKALAAGMAAVEHGFRSYVPLEQVFRHRGRKLVQETVSRFGDYIFVEFDREDETWPRLTRNYGSTRAYFTRILCNADNHPSPVPNGAMQAIRAYEPPIVEPEAPIVYQPGQSVTCIIAGVRRQAVFVEYCGNRPMVRTWIFGADRVTEVRTAELEPVVAEVLNLTATKV